MTFESVVKSEFVFLGEYGYECQNNATENYVEWKCPCNSLEVIFDTYSYELSCQFIRNEDYVTLQDVLDYEKIIKYKGMYQLSNKSQVCDGVKYLASVIKGIMEKTDISNENSFRILLEYRAKRKKELLEAYYVNLDLKEAEELYQKKEYEKAYSLFKKRKTYLSRSQNKKLEYLAKIL